MVMSKTKKIVISNMNMGEHDYKLVSIDRIFLNGSYFLSPIRSQILPL